MSDFELGKALEPHENLLAEHDEATEERLAIQEEGKAPQEETIKPRLEFPKHVMSGAAGAFAETYSQYLETPPSFLYMAYLTVLGNVVSDMITLKSEIKPEPRLFTVILGRSADERKSTAISKTVDFFRTVLTENPINVCYGAGSAEGLAKALQERPRLVLTIDELKTFVQKARIEGSVLLPCVNSLFEENRFHSVTKKHKIEVENAHLSMLAASTLDTYQTMFGPAFLDIGFINRLFIVVDRGQKKFAIPKMIPQEAKDKLGKDLQGVLTIADRLSQRQKPYPVPIAPQGYQLFEQWYFDTPSSEFTKRLDAYGHRFMPLLAVNDQKEVADTETVEKVIALLNYQLAARRECDPVDADNKIAALEERIRRALSNGPLTRGQLARKVNKSRAGIWAWNSAIRNLEKDGDISWDKKRKVYEKV